MAALGETRGLHDVLEALAHDRDVPGAAIVGAGGVQAEETLFAYRASVLVEGQHADVVHVTRAVHGGARIGLGEDQRIHLHAGRKIGGGKTCQRSRRGIRVLASHQAQAGSLHRAQHRFAVLRRHFVLAITEEGEMVVGGPAQESLRFGALPVAHRHDAIAEFVGDGLHLRPHLLPVRHRGAHVVQGARDLVAQLPHRLLVGLAIDFEMHEGFRRTVADRQQLPGSIASQREDRMHDPVHGDAVLGHQHADRIHQEGHVVVVDLHDGMGAVDRIAGGRVEHADQRLPGRALTGQFEGAQRDAGPVGRRTQREFLLGQPGEIGPGEIAGQDLLGSGRFRLHGCEDGIEGSGSGLGVHETRFSGFQKVRNCTRYGRPASSSPCPKSPRPTGDSRPPGACLESRP